MSEKVVHEWKDMTPVGPCRQRCFEDGRAQFKVFGMGTWMDLAESKSTTARQLAALAARVEELEGEKAMWKDLFNSTMREVKGLKAERDRLRVALEWFTKNNPCMYGGSDNTNCRLETSTDPEEWCATCRFGTLLETLRGECL